MHREPTVPNLRVLVVLNPVAGTSTPAAVRSALERHFRAGIEGTLCEIHETRHGDLLADLVRDAVGRGVQLVVAAGGDGTVSAVANGLIGSDTPLGILPLGTANVLARELGVPVDLDAACELLAGTHALTTIDGMRVDGRCYFTQVGVGLDSLMIRDTRREDKRRFGRIAYLWTAFTRLLGFEPKRFALVIDATRLRPRALQVLVANSGILGQPPFRWGPDIRPDDGRLDVCIIRARNLLDYFKIAWHFILRQHRQSPNVRYLRAEHHILIQTRSRPMPVQADGEIIGETPVDVEAVPGAVRVIVPAPESEMSLA